MPASMWHTGSVPGTPPMRGRSAMADAMAERPPRRDSYDRPTGCSSIDETPRRFSTGAGGLPMPSTASLLAEAAHELEIKKRSRSRARARRERTDIDAAASQFDLNTGKPSIARLAALTSPCYFHKRFDDAVDIDRVIDEIKGDAQLSRSRLMQTAAGVREVSRQLQRRPLKNTVRNVMIITKARDNNLVSLTRQLAEWLIATPRYGRDIGVKVWVDSKLQKSKRFDVSGLLAKDVRYKDMLDFWTPALCLERAELFDLVITLGGDGTVLFTSWLFQRIVPPVLAFSLGSLGFLTNFDFSNYKEQLNKNMGDEGMHINMRMRFTCTVYRAAADSSLSCAAASSSDNLSAISRLNSIDSHASVMIEGETHEVLNELVIDRGPSSYISSLDLYANDSLLTRISADGIILSTPTGSTAYSLSAGGSLVHPDIPAILLTPICPHTLSFRPMLLNDDMALKVAIPRSGRGGAFVSFDGKGRVELGRGDEVVVRASQYPFPSVKAAPLEWFDSISRTLRWNTRAAEQKAWDSSSGNADESAIRDDNDDESQCGFDIDFEEPAAETSGIDSGYGGTTANSEAGSNHKPQWLGHWAPRDDEIH